MGFHKDYLVSIDISYFFATFLYLVLPSITQFYWVSIHVTQLFFCISNGITQFYWVFTEFFFFAFYSVVQLFPGADGNNFVAMATRANRVYLVFQFLSSCVSRCFLAIIRRAKRTEFHGKSAIELPSPLDRLTSDSDRYLFGIFSLSLPSPPSPLHLFFTEFCDRSCRQ